MGTRFQLTLSDSEIDALSVPSWEKAMLHALHTYGAYAADVTGGGQYFDFEFSGCDMYESVYGATCPFVTYAQQLGITPDDFDGDGNREYQFDWHSGYNWWQHLRVVPPPAH